MAKDIAIVGATGFVGQHLVEEGLSRGYKITVIVRNPDKVKNVNPNLTVKKADILNESEFVDSLRGYDTLINAFNSGWTNPNIYEDNMKGEAAIQNAAKKAGVKRLFIIGGAGSLEVKPGIQLVDTPGFPEAFKQGSLSMRDYLNIIKKENELEWTFLCPAVMMSPADPGVKTGKYRIGKDQPIFNEKGESKISVHDLAVAVFDELENNNFIRKRFTVGY